MWPLENRTLFHEASPGEHAHRMELNLEPSCSANHCSRLFLFSTIYFGPTNGLTLLPLEPAFYRRRGTGIPKLISTLYEVMKKKRRRVWQDFGGRWVLVPRSVTVKCYRWRTSHGADVVCSRRWRRGGGSGGQWLVDLTGQVTGGVMDKLSWVSSHDEGLQL